MKVLLAQLRSSPRPNNFFPFSGNPQESSKMIGDSALWIILRGCDEPLDEIAMLVWAKVFFRKTFWLFKYFSFVSTSCLPQKKVFPILVGNCRLWESLFKVTNLFYCLFLVFFTSFFFIIL